ncbi:hypothetical protein SAHY_04473 [Salinisphaera hydrothermalis EPR70]
MSEHHAAKRPEDDPPPECGERRECADRGIGWAEEWVVENQGGDDAVEQKVVPIDHRAEESRERGTARLFRIMDGCGGNGGGLRHDDRFGGSDGGRTVAALAAAVARGHGWPTLAHLASAKECCA